MLLTSLPKCLRTVLKGLGVAWERTPVDTAKEKPGGISESDESAADDAVHDLRTVKGLTVERAVVPVRFSLSHSHTQQRSTLNIFLQLPQRRHSFGSPEYRRPHNHTIEEAYGALAADVRLPLSPPRHRARSRIQHAFAQNLTHPDTFRDQLSTHLRDLDILLFNCALGGAIPAIWVASGAGRWARTVHITSCNRADKGSLTIELEEKLLSQPPAFVWGTLVHEMLHAYAMGWTLARETCACGEVLDHGPLFQAAAVGAVHVLGLEGLGVPDVVDLTMVLCHSDGDEAEICERKGGESALDEEVEGWLVMFWGLFRSRRSS